MSKRIVICCDGTWNRPEQPVPSNVVRTARAVLPTAPDGVAQVVFYDEGVGTGNRIDRLLGGAFGDGLVKNIADGYRFLVHNYEEGDELFLFGFSRGAYTARSLAGLLRNAGLLHKAHADHFTAAFDLYRRQDAPPSSPEAQAFRAAHSREVGVHFLGVWDTVGSLGIPLRGLRYLTMRRHQFHDVELSGSVRNAFQALAVDERRFPFLPSIWLAKPKEGQRVEQAWFPGVHADVGGGYADHAIGDAALAWMLGRAASCGLALDDAYLDATTHPDPVGGALHDSRQGFYRWMRPHARAIGRDGGATEAAHAGTVARHAAGGYDPANLAAYLAEPAHRETGG